MSTVILVRGQPDGDLVFDDFTCKILFVKEPFGGYTVRIPAIPSFTCYGETLDEACDRFYEAFDDFLNDLEKRGAGLELIKEHLCYD